MESGVTSTTKKGKNNEQDGEVDTVLTVNDIKIFQKCLRLWCFFKSILYDICMFGIINEKSIINIFSNVMMNETMDGYFKMFKEMIAILLNANDWKCFATSEMVFKLKDTIDAQEICKILLTINGVYYCKQ